MQCGIGRYRQVALAIPFIFALTGSIAVEAAPSKTNVSENWNVQFAPPSGWVAEKTPKSSIPGARDVRQWLSFDRGDEEFVELAKRPIAGLSAAGFAQFHREWLKHWSESIYVDRSQTLCSGQPGWYMKYSRSENYVAESVFIADESNVYSASYIYPANLKPSPRGEQALHSLCLQTYKQSVPVVLPVTFSVPPGWVSVDVSSKRKRRPELLGYYADPKDARFSQAIILMQTPDQNAQVPAGAIADTDSTPKAKVTISRGAVSTERICGDSVALSMHYSGTINARKIEGEELLLLGPKMYLALYFRLATTPPSPQAHAALRTICPRPASEA